MVQRSLYEMIGVSEDADPDDVRYAYEQAMRMATRGGDHRRAVELSAAFDSLDPRSRRLLFPAARSGSGSARGEHSASLYPGDYDLGGRPGPGYGSRPPGSRQFVRSAAAVLVGLAVLLTIGLYVWRTQIPHDTRPANPFPTQSYQAPSDPARIAGPRFQVPAGAPTDSDGMVNIACGSYLTSAYPGDMVSCDDGTTPRLASSR